MDFVFSFVIAMLVSMLTLPVLMGLAQRFQFIDQPSPRKVHAAPIPRIGGPAIALGLVLAVVLIARDLLAAKTIALLVAGLIVLLVGLLDDRRELGYRPKFAAQFAAAIIVVWLGGVQLHSLTVPFSVTIPDWLSYPASVLLVVALMNAVALSDGLDGLAGGVVFLCCVALGVLGYLTGNFAAALIAIALAGALFGFLRFNTHPASVFMGDSGSQFIGLVSAVLAIDVTQSENATISAALPLFLLAVPVIDTIQVSLLRIRQGRSPFVADKNHLHHRLLGLGLKHHQAVLAIYVVQGIFFLLAYFLRFQSDLLLLTLFLSLAALIVVSINVAERLSPRRQGASRSQELRVPRGERRLWFSIASSHLVTGLLLLYAALIAVRAVLGNAGSEGHSETVIWQVRTLVLVMLAALAVCVAYPKRRASRATMTGIAYVACALLAFAASSASWGPGRLDYLEAAILVALGLACAGSLAFENRSGAQLTTLDILILFGVLAIPNLPGLMVAETGIGMLGVRLVVCFYAAEIVATGTRGMAALPLATVLGTILVHLHFMIASS